ncbi:MAG: T9SS type A sorting domain-containing protein [Bacteroidetes bacterium]|nr:T9SS type A sorting domain-containing protein [Bacteroidota bacterium]
MKSILLFVLAVFFTAGTATAQCLTSLQSVGELPSVFTQSTFTVRKDKTGRPFMYVASKEGGLKIADISNPALPVPIDTIPASAFNGYHVISLTQVDSQLYLALGNIYDTPAQGAAMAIIDISNPYNAFITDTWYSPFPIGGCGAVEIEGSHAYLGGMYNGLIILDISDANNVTWKSTYLPSMAYPHGVPPTDADSVKFNVRGIAVRNDTVFACFDRGGFRVIDVTNKTAPVQIAQFCNPSMVGFATAYNNVVLHEGLAYVAVDYQGIEVLDISTAGVVGLTGSWKGPSWPAPTNNPFIWLAAEGHANELRYDEQQQLVYTATGRGDLLVLDVSDPTQPDSCSFYGGVNNSIGTWGLDFSNDTVYLAYIVTAVPFSSNWTGIKIIAVNPATAGLTEISNEDMFIYPNPSQSTLTVHLPVGQNLSVVELFDLSGKLINTPNIGSSQAIDVSGIHSGLYFVKATDSSGRNYFARCVVEK